MLEKNVQILAKPARASDGGNNGLGRPTTVSANPPHSALPGTELAERTQRRMRWLVWLHYALGVFTFATALPLIPAFAGGWEILHGDPSVPLSPRASEAVQWVKWLPEDYDLALRAAWVIMLAGTWVTLCAAHGLVLLYVGRCLALRKRYLLCVLFSIFNVTHLPLGTVLSVYTLVAIVRPEVKQLFFPTTAGVG